MHPGNEGGVQKTDFHMKGLQDVKTSRLPLWLLLSYCGSTADCHVTVSAVVALLQCVVAGFSVEPGSSITWAFYTSEDNNCDTHTYANILNFGLGAQTLRPLTLTPCAVVLCEIDQVSRCLCYV